MAPLQLFIGRDLAAFFRILLVISRFSAHLSTPFEEYILLTGESPHVLMASVVKHLKDVYEGHVTIKARRIPHSDFRAVSETLTSRAIFFVINATKQGRTIVMTCKANCSHDHRRAHESPLPPLMT